MKTQETTDHSAVLFGLMLSLLMVLILLPPKYRVALQSTGVSIMSSSTETSTVELQTPSIWMLCEEHSETCIAQKSDHKMYQQQQVFHTAGSHSEI